MNRQESSALPIFVVSHQDGRQMHVVMSVGAFQTGKDGNTSEAMMPVIEDALNLAQDLSGTDTLHSFYLQAGPGDEVVERMREMVKRSFDAAKRPVLWLRADSEMFLKAALSILRVDYSRVSVVTPKIREGASA
jgi:hypothetical protein